MNYLGGRIWQWKNAGMAQPVLRHAHWLLWPVTLYAWRRA